MDTRDTSGPAFPFGTRVIVRDGYGDGEKTVEENEPGMTLRDYFAAKAMAAWHANPIPDDRDIHAIAAWAYRQADAMLKERA